MKTFCPRCGRPMSTTGLCSRCAEPDHVELRRAVKLCPTERGFYKGSWSQFPSLKSFFWRVFDQEVPGAALVKGFFPSEEVLRKPGLQGDLHFLLFNEGSWIDFEIMFEVTYSPKAKKMQGGYYEGKLQLRNAGKKRKEAVKKRLNDWFDREIYINKIAEHEDGVDLYFAEKNKVQVVVDELRGVFGGTVKTSQTLHTRDKQTQKDVYRITTLLRFPRFNEKDVVEFDDVPVKVVGIGRKVETKNLRSGKRSDRFLAEDEAKELSALEKHRTVVDRVDSEGVYVLSHDSYQEEHAVNGLDIRVVPGQKVTVVRGSDDALYIVK